MFKIFTTFFQEETNIFTLLWLVVVESDLLYFSQNNSFDFYLIIFFSQQIPQAFSSNRF